ncbi:MAG: hypothetical protein JWL65_706, partial [Gammaproteobacteria bacterium]|nr:hypothetical protein [Gammaproteobacteria bacterium]
GGVQDEGVRVLGSDRAVRPFSHIYVRI